MRVSIVIPTWRGGALLRKNLPFLLRSLERSSHSVEVIVVDDGSDDGTPEFLFREFPRIQVLVHDENRGFSAACLTGAKAAQGEVMILLNNDIIISENLVDALMPYFKQEDTFSVSPLVVDESGGMSSVSLRIPFLRRGKLKFEKIKEVPVSPRYTLFCSGGSAAYSRGKFLELDGFNPLYYPFYLEDQEVGLRAWRRGWKSYLEPRVRVTHPSGGTIKAHFQKRFVARIKKRNEIIFGLNNMLDTKLLVIGVLLPLSAKLLYKWLTFRLDYYWGFFSAVRCLPEICQQREKERHSSVLSETEIFNLIARSRPAADSAR